MKAFALVVSLMAGMLAALPIRADAPPWAVTWLPWNPTYASWDWSHNGHAITIESASSAAFPANVKTWNLAICSAADPANKTLVHLPKPGAAAHLDLGKWTPGRFPVGQLDALGEGTFLCAILGDGQRYSNVSRVTIGHSYSRSPMPGVEVFALAFPDQDIRRFAVRVVPAPEQQLYAMDLANPAVSINGSWRRVGELKSSGQNDRLEAGTPHVAIVPLDNYDPPIPPFKKADVQVKIIENYQRAAGAIQSFAAGQAHGPVIKQWIDAQPGPTSLVCTLTATETDAINFDQAFDLK